jgi:hypothetical protein
MTDLKNEDFTTGIVLLIRYKILSIPEHILSLLAFVRGIVLLIRYKILSIPEHILSLLA